MVIKKDKMRLINNKNIRKRNMKGNYKSQITVSEYGESLKLCIRMNAYE